MSICAENTIPAMVKISERIIRGEGDKDTWNTYLLHIDDLLDARFAFLPRVVGARIVSSTIARMRPDGKITIEIESHPAKGDNYESTRTTLIGSRVGDVGVAPPLPSVASGPPDTDDEEW